VPSMGGGKIKWSYVNKKQAMETCGVNEEGLQSSVISGFCRVVNEIFALLGCYT
jgi:hypothetical protein